MTMLSAQRRITKQALFSAKRLGEEISYTDKSGTHKIIAIVEIGPEMTRSDWNSAHTRIEDSAITDIAEISVLGSDIPNPTEGDSIVYNNTKWNVTQIFKYDSAGDNYVLICTKNSKAYGL